MIAFFSNKVFLIKMCTFFRHNATVHLIDNSINIIFLCTRKPKIHVTGFPTIFTLLQWPGMEPMVSLRYTHVYTYVWYIQYTHLFWTQFSSTALSHCVTQ